MSDSLESVYPNLSFPFPDDNRPYTFINMVATIDGKTVSGKKDEPVADLGSRTDHATMRSIEQAADAILIGAGNLRSVPGLWYEEDKIRCVATRSGNLDYNARFFADSPQKALVLAPASVDVPDKFGRLPEDLRQALNILRTKYGVRWLLIEGGSEINGDFLKRNLVDELFLTIAPKIKLGNCLPTYAGGEPLAKNNLQSYKLTEYHVVGDEIFARYRRREIS